MLEKTMNSKAIERKEARQYAKGQPVELKQQPGQIYIIAEYDPMMVPPIWLKDDPMPHYPEELKLMSNLFCFWPLKQANAA